MREGASERGEIILHGRREGRKMSQLALRKGSKCSFGDEFDDFGKGSSNCPLADLARSLWTLDVKG